MLCNNRSLLFNIVSHIYKNLLRRFQNKTWLWYPHSLCQTPPQAVLSRHPLPGPWRRQTYLSRKTWWRSVQTVYWSLFLYPGRTRKEVSRAGASLLGWAPSSHRRPGALPSRPPGRQRVVPFSNTRNFIFNVDITPPCLYGGQNTFIGHHGRILNSITCKSRRKWKIFLKH